MAHQNNAHRPSRHSIDRWTQRVNPCATRADAYKALAAIAASGRVVSSPRGWVRKAMGNIGTGTVAVISADWPDVAAVVDVRNHVIKTVLTRDLVRAQNRTPGKAQGDRRRGRPTVTSWSNDDQNWN